MRRYQHPVNRRLVEDAPIGVRVAERVTRFIGSWKFVLLQTALVTVWVLINIGFLTGIVPFDPYPFILLNLAFSTQAAYAAPLILIASNRSADRDRMVLEHVAKEEVAELERLRQISRSDERIITRLDRLEILVRALAPVPPMTPVPPFPSAGDRDPG